MRLSPNVTITSTAEPGYSPRAREQLTRLVIIYPGDLARFFLKTSGHFRHKCSVNYPKRWWEIGNREGRKSDGELSSGSGGVVYSCFEETVEYDCVLHHDVTSSTRTRSLAREASLRYGVRPSSTIDRFEFIWGEPSVPLGHPHWV